MTEENVAAFTIRIPKQLKDQIDARARVQRRPRNAEITIMLEEAIDRSVGRDRDLIKSSRDQS